MTKKTNIKLYNALSSNKQEFKPVVNSRALVYACGPTVYDYAHIGNLRAYVFVDVLVRTLKFLGYSTKLVMNITDVGHLTSDEDRGEDKLQKSAEAQKITAWDIAKKYTSTFLEDLEKLNILKPDIMPRATDHIQDQIELIRQIEKNGFTYKISDGLYFDTSKMPDYGDFARLDLKGQEKGARIGENKEKRNPQDFALWRFSYPNGRSFDSALDDASKKRHMEWNSPWGMGFPGWHIECSAMSTKYLGLPFDIHTGGIDHLSVHHTNEIAQTKAATGKLQANYWLHNEHLLVNGQKMSKSKGNYYVLSDLIKRGIDPLAFRYLLLTVHYRDKLNFTFDALLGAGVALDKIKSIDWQKGKIDEKALIEGMEMLADDLAIPKLIGFLHKEGNPWLWLQFEPVLGLGLRKEEKEVKLTAGQEKLVFEREESRKAGDFQKADELRKELEGQGILIKDKPWTQN